MQLLLQFCGHSESTYRYTQTYTVMPGSDPNLPWSRRSYPL